MGLSVSPDIYQGIMSAIFSDMENVICFIDNIALIMNKSFENHLKQLDEILHQLEDNNLQVNGNKSSFCAIEAEFLEFVLTNKESNLKSKRSKQLSRLLCQKQSNKSIPSLA
jgi:ABC-type uncharacterized transport system substrate-binding protein